MTPKNFVKIKKTVLLICFASFTFAQNIKATYKVTVTEKESYANEFERDFLSKTYNSVNRTNAYLLFNNSESMFYLDKNAIIENNLVKVIILSVKNSLYTDLNNKLNYYYADSENFSVTDSILNNWILSSKSKMINNLQCYEATLVHKYTNGKYDSNGKLNQFSKFVTAWYSPEINYNFGPRGFGGLPGLIIELQYDDVFYGLSKIEFGVDEKIESINKNKTIPKKEYDKYIYKEIQDNLKSKEIGLNKK